MNLWGPNIHVKPDPTDTTVLKTVARMQLGSSISDALDLDPDHQYLQMRVGRFQLLFPVSVAPCGIHILVSVRDSMSPAWPCQVAMAGQASER